MKELKTYFKQINAYDKVITDLDDSDFKFDRFEYDRFEYDRFEPDNIDLESTLLESGTTNAEKLLLIAQDPYIYYNSSDYFNMSNLDNFTSKVSNTWSGISREEEYEQKIKQDKANIFSFKDINPDDNYEDIKKKILSNMDKIRDAKCKRMTVKELIDRCETVIETEDKNFDILKKVVNNYSKEIKTQEENCIASLNIKTRVAEQDNKDDDVIDNFKKIKKSISESTSFLISVIRLAFDLNKSAIIACSKIANLNDGMRRSTEKYLGD